MARLLGGIVLGMAMLLACLPASAQELVSHKLLPAPTELRAAIPDFHASLDEPAASSNQPVRHRHWTKGGKIMTGIGAGLLVGGGIALAHGLNNANSYSCTSGGTCVAVDWKVTGGIWLGTGAVLTVLGVTRHSTD